MSQPHINELRSHLLDTLKDLRRRNEPMEPDRARAIAQVAGVLVDSAKVEVDFLKATHQEHSDFFGSPTGTPVNLPALDRQIHSTWRPKPGALAGASE